MFCYSTQRVSVRTDSDKLDNFNPLKCDATKCYLEHYANSVVLTHFLNFGTLAEKHQAQKELEICERKMKYWKRQPHFNMDLAVTGIERLSKGCVRQRC